MILFVSKVKLSFGSIQAPSLASPLQALSSGKWREKDTDGDCFLFSSAQIGARQVDLCHTERAWELLTYEEE